LKVTDSVHVLPEERWAVPQVDKPPPALKSSPEVPMVRTLTVDTEPAAVAVTVTLCAADVVPTF
jgi:hypothetical protein